MLEERQRELAQKITSLVSLAEIGVKMEEVATRLRELERQKTELEYVRRSCEAIEEREAYDDGIAKKVTESFSNFERHFDQAPISERKALVHLEGNNKAGTLLSPALIAIRQSSINVCPQWG